MVLPGIQLTNVRAGKVNGGTVDGSTIGLQLHAHGAKLFSSQPSIPAK